MGVNRYVHNQMMKNLFIWHNNYIICSIISDFERLVWCKGYKSMFTGSGL